MFHIVDDEKYLADILVEILVSEGHQAMAYADPVEYRNLAYSDNYTPPVCLFSDIRMPELNGHQLAEQIRLKHPGQRVVLFSGFDEAFDTLEMNACHFLTKPFQIEQFLSVIHAVIECSAINPSKARSMCLVDIVQEQAGDFVCY